MAPRYGDRTETFRATRPFALVAVADPGIRADITRRLRGMGATTVMETATIAETRRLLMDGIPRGLVVLDVNLPGGPGVRLLPELRRLGFRRTVLLSGTDDPQSARIALTAGVRGYLSVRTPGLTASLVPVQRSSSETHSQAGPLSLSAREVQVLQLVAQGRSNRDVGLELGLSALTVKSHLARIGRKLGSGDRAEMVALSMRSGLVT